MQNTPTSLGTSQKGVVHVALPIIVLIAAAVLVSANVQTSQKFPDDQNVQGVLAERGSSASNRGNSGSGDSGKSNSGSSENRGGPSTEVKLRQEVRTSDERIKTEIREDRLRVDIRQENTRTRLEQRGNEFLIKTKIESEDDEDEATEGGSEDEADGDEATQSADEDEDEDEGEVVQSLRAISKFPLRIDLATNQLIMTKNGVERVLTVLPAQAVQNMLRAHLKKGLGPKFFRDASPSALPSTTPAGTPSASATPSAEPGATPSASPTEEPISTESAELTVLEDQITLEESDGQIVYKIPSKKHLRVFGLIPITTNLTGFVSADTGVLIREQQSLLARILDLLSP
ncbi:hypothetical protein A2867_01275 [Candidatus Daviesbacteria bacterium RIFCSPHIGHO2_01_FULL_40_11]|uniref:Uncharacterized protein n=1 Tax=Candidatus Daviesbacteria bacterium RIFCSPHIGHO2_01_FULL_40_11 TaxID=1797762 RepID=A0A1F5JHX0_9BACT|nr:MAG: hypothetical protein A2867_01275 [Candidatus Daviesbacteria bacterium RIFCSPHIGHO2_01_FULL_40_11]